MCTSVAVRALPHLARDHAVLQHFGHGDGKVRIVRILGSGGSDRVSVRLTTRRNLKRREETLTIIRDMSKEGIPKHDVNVGTKTP